MAEGEGAGPHALLVPDHRRPVRHEYANGHEHFPQPAQQSVSFEFLVVGAGRSGTSLVASLLDGHPKLEVAFEQDSAAILMSIDEPSRNRAVRFRNRCRELAAGFPSKQWGNKVTTEQIEGLENESVGSSMEALQLFFDDVMRDVVKVVVVRDGRTCVRSKLERNPQSTIAEACRRWRYSVFVHDFLVQRSDVVSLRYEDVIRDARSALLPACARLGVAWNDAMLAGTSSSKLLPEYRQEGIGSARPVVDDPLPSSMATMETDLRRLGYT